jgi:hypothetical protein
MNDTDLPPLEPDVFAVIAGASGIDPAPAVARLRVRDRVEAAIAGAGSGGGGSGTASAARPAVAAPSGLRLSAFSMRAAVPLALSFVLGAITSAAVLIALGAPRVTLRPDAPSVASGALGGRPLAEEPAPALSEESPESTVAAGATPSAPVVAASPRAEAQSPRSQLARERRLLDQARAALERGEPAVALSAAARHERQFPSGALAQEREAMAIRALVALGRTGEARARAARFHARYPDSVLLSTIDEMLDAAASR